MEPSGACTFDAAKDKIPKDANGVWVDGYKWMTVDVADPSQEGENQDCAALCASDPKCVSVTRWGQDCEFFDRQDYVLQDYPYGTDYLTNIKCTGVTPGTLFHVSSFDSE